MLHTVKLLLPALIPSWRFFDRVAPSPRIEFRTFTLPQEDSDRWQEFRPRPAYLPISDMLKRMVWNPRWNESLFLVSCAERLTENPTEHSIQEIRNRIQADVGATYLQFRLVFVSRNGTELQKDIAFISEIYPPAGRAEP